MQVTLNAKCVSNENRYRYSCRLVVSENVNKLMKLVINLLSLR